MITGEVANTYFYLNLALEPLIFFTRDEYINYYTQPVLEMTSVIKMHISNKDVLVLNFPFINNKAIILKLFFNENIFFTRDTHDFSTITVNVHN